MATKTLYDATGTAIRVLHITEPGKDLFAQDWAVETIEDAEPIVEEVKVLRDNHREHGGDMKHVARVPLSVAERAMREGWFHDQKAWARWCNDPDNRDFRVWGGRV